jgi:hypothetical protein
MANSEVSALRLGSWALWLKWKRPSVATSAASAASIAATASIAAAAGVTAAGIAGAAGIGMAVAAAEPAASGVVVRGSGVDGGLRAEGCVAAEVSLGDFRAHGVVITVLACLPVMVVEVVL